MKSHVFKKVIHSKFQTFRNLCEILFIISSESTSWHQTVHRHFLAVGPCHLPPLWALKRARPRWSGGEASRNDENTSRSSNVAYFIVDFTNIICLILLHPNLLKRPLPSLSQQDSGRFRGIAPVQVESFSDFQKFVSKGSGTLLGENLGTSNRRIQWKSQLLTMKINDFTVISLSEKCQASPSSDESPNLSNGWISSTLSLAFDLR